MCLNECADELWIKSSSWHYKVAAKLRSELMIVRTEQTWWLILFWCWSFQFGRVQVSVEAVVVSVPETGSVLTGGCVFAWTWWGLVTVIWTLIGLQHRERRLMHDSAPSSQRRDNTGVSWSWSPSKTFRGFSWWDIFLGFLFGNINNKVVLVWGARRTQEEHVSQSSQRRGGHVLLLSISQNKHRFLSEGGLNPSWGAAITIQELTREEPRREGWRGHVSAVRAGLPRGALLSDV